jgi:hypothetical protein
MRKKLPNLYTSEKDSPITAFYCLPRPQMKQNERLLG